MSGLSSGVWHWPLVRGTSRRDSQTRASSSRGDFCLLILTPSIYDRSREMAAVHAAVFPLSHALSERGHETETREARSAKKPTGNPYTPRREFSRSKVKSHTPPLLHPKGKRQLKPITSSSSGNIRFPIVFSSFLNCPSSFRGVKIKTKDQRVQATKHALSRSL